MPATGPGFISLQARDLDASQAFTRSTPASSAHRPDLRTPSRSRPSRSRSRFATSFPARTSTPSPGPASARHRLTTAAHSHPTHRGIRVTTIGTTGTSGAPGSLVLDERLARSVPANSLVALVRDPAKAAERAAAGIDVRQADYNDTAVWPTALAGVDVLLLVSASEPGKRVAQHAAVIDGAKSAGVQRIVYTSLLRADTSQLVLAPDHKATEELLAASGLTVTLLRNGYYITDSTRPSERRTR